MAKAAVISAVYGRLETAWNQTAVVGLNDNSEAPYDLSDWLVVQFPAASNWVIDVKAKQRREEGGVLFLLHTSRGKGILEPTQMLEDLSDLFAHLRIGGVLFGEPGSPSFNNENDEGPFWVSSIILPYVYDYGE